jgi:hypothetical protein
MNETEWLPFENSRKVPVGRGTETVKLRLKSIEKTSFTALGAISAAGREFPLWVLAKGRIQRSSNSAVIQMSWFTTQRMGH